MKQSKTKSWSLLLMHQLRINCTCNSLQDQQDHNMATCYSTLNWFFSCLFINQIKVSNSALISAFMTELEPETPVTQVCYDIYLPEILLAILNLVCVFIYFCVIAVWLWSPATVNQFTNGEKYGIFDWMHGWLVTRTTKGLFRFSFSRVFSFFLIFEYILTKFLLFQFQFHYRSLSRQQAQQQAWLQKRRYDFV